MHKHKRVFLDIFIIFAAKISVFMSNKEKFYIYNNDLCDKTLDYNQVMLIINAVKSFARSTYRSVYIIDYCKKEIPYVSEDIAYFLGRDVEQIKNNIVQIFKEVVPEDELTILSEIREKGIDFYKGIQAEQKKEWSIICDFHVKGNNGIWLINHSLTPILLTPEGKVWLVLCTVSISTKNKKGNAVIRNYNATGCFEYSFFEHSWHKTERPILSKEEKQVLLLSAQGYTTKNISKQMHKSVDTIKTYKRKLFNKLDVHSTAEALVNAINYRLL
jgi:Response regulator containing a CheY-like receiver domain and an HTH DNA-binding domain